MGMFIGKDHNVCSVMWHGACGRKLLVKVIPDHHLSKRLIDPVSSSLTSKPMINILESSSEHNQGS